MVWVRRTNSGHLPRCSPALVMAPMAAPAAAPAAEAPRSVAPRRRRTHTGRHQRRVRAVFCWLRLHPQVAGIDDECNAYSKDACARAWVGQGTCVTACVRKKDEALARTCTLDPDRLCLFGGGARVSEEGVFVRKECRIVESEGSQRMTGDRGSGGLGVAERGYSE